MVGNRASTLGIRFVMHPDQFVVLNSESSNVIANGIKILTMHATILDYLQQPLSSWAIIEIHGGKGNRGPQLVSAIQELPENVRTRLALENNEYTYSVDEILEICHAVAVPMVFDAHHHIVTKI